MTREEILTVAKPILFNTEMVRAIKDNRKTVTRRVVKFPKGQTGRLSECGARDYLYYPGGIKRPPYRSGDILYVRETFFRDNAGKYHYKSDDGLVFFEKDIGHGPGWFFPKWNPSIHMPKEAARLFLRVTDVRVERLQDITEEQAKAEGAVKAYPYTDPITKETVFAESKYGIYLAGFECLWNMCYAAPRGVKGRGGVITHYESYPFEEIRETRTYKGKPWYVIGNPWVWGYEFEKMEVEK